MHIKIKKDFYIQSNNVYYCFFSEEPLEQIVQTFISIFHTHCHIHCCNNKRHN
ncbi:unnamed protein product [Paramecium primaurelia]|uniref:Uncharacterized protein n=1 Tax=Paramecium primaurelia TaxID=5886 RepID=A0A8S1PPD2_PARPR|nr:unnamed protein product [Paramecium primaurelia]